MKTYLIVDKLAAKSGIYGINVNKTQLKDFIKKEYPSLALLIIPYYGIPAFAGYVAFKLGFKLGKNSVPKLTKIADLKSVDKLIGKSDSNDILFDDAIILFSDLINNKYKIIDHKMFDSVFKKPEQLKEVLPSDRMAELIIISKKSALKHFPKTQNIMLGLNVANDDNTMLIPLPDYSNRKWTMLTTSICHIFPYLGAKRIMIKDCTDKSIKLESKFEAKAIECGMNYAMKRKFEIEETFADCRYEPDAVKDKIFLLSEAPHIKQKALDLIQCKRNSIMKFTESLDVSFGLSLNLLLSFQGAFEGGFKREFNVELEF